MPNGDPQFHSKQGSELELFFSPVAGALAEFARKHNLKSEKYYHQAPSWSLTFRHPRGGVGKLEVRREGPQNVALVSSWWYDEYDTLTRFSKSQKSKPLLCEPKVLGRELEVSLMLILSWQLGTWDESTGGNHAWRKNWSKQQFDALLDDYPVVRT